MVLLSRTHLQTSILQKHQSSSSNPSEQPAKQQTAKMPFETSSDSKSVVPLWINGRPKQLDESRLIEVVRSALTKTVHYAQSANAADATEAVDSAWKAFPSWSTTSHVRRRDLLNRVASLYEQRADEIAHWQVTETSCPEQYAHFNIKLACGMLREFAGAITTAFTGEIPPMEAEGYGFVFKQPVGPVLLIPPWNSSIILSTRGVAAALAAGCTVVMKASELCPRTHQVVVEIFEEAGLPSGCLNQIQASRDTAAEVTDALISHPNIRKVEFIGSASVGRVIGQLCSKYLKPILMELGGKGPAIVLADADLKRTAALCAFGAFLHHGQICFSTERIIVVEEVAEEFQKLLKEEVTKNYSSVTGTAVNKTGADHAHSMLEDAKASGATFLAGDNTFLDPPHNASLRPTIITSIPQNAAIADEETFGPSASLYVVKDSESAVALANNSKYGLNATVHTRDMYAALDMAKKLEYGQVHVNAPTVYDVDTLPIKGVKGSGWGSNNGKYGIEEFLVSKTVTLQRVGGKTGFGQ